MKYERTYQTLLNKYCWESCDGELRCGHISMSKSLNPDGDFWLDDDEKGVTWYFIYIYKRKNFNKDIILHKLKERWLQKTFDKMIDNCD